MVHVRIVDNRVIIVKETGSNAKITVADSHVEISGDAIIRLEVGDVEVSIRKENFQQLSLFDETPPITKQTPMRDKRGHFIKPPGALSSADYIEQAVKQFGKPFKSVKEIMPLVQETDFKTSSEDPLNIVRSFLHNDKRFTKTGEGLWTLVEWHNAKEQVAQNDNTVAM